ncbi:DNA primase [Mycetocola tolaasinivorans]|uniref:DNA primase n=1 Tax=Mycetocola tolaasinivorans TaxID=76635 RepID=A0A3L7AA94_9MICO|nr:DNA primase [Mycetocola tolaasinivorans]RLP76894.1 DNA primase [Mycetocola tolaasinivorans]
MAGLIRQSDIDEVKSRTNIADIVGDHVTLKSAGVGSMKGLCPFHDERSPSFHVRPQLGYYHCFGCGESGDAISFLQKIDHVSFSEAVERLAARAGIVLQYEEGGSGRSDHGQRARLLAANNAAGVFFREQLGAPDAEPGRKFLGERGFDPAAAEHFGVGFAPKSWDRMTNALKAQGFTVEELLAAGLVSQGDRGVYDRFRGRLVWPIRDVTGQTIGFGARRLLEDDKGPKYLNTPETAVYHKNQVLYGLDLAKRDISRGGQVVVVEGYTDVMAAHLAGITTAVATCGTAFGVEHIRLIRRIMGDDSGTGEVVFTFDPDAAGQKAAMRAFAEEKRFSAQTYVAVAPDGLDPCDLRLARGDAAVRALLENKEPMFEFVIRQLLSEYDLESVEGRVGALRVAAPVIAEIRDPAIRPGYTRVLARQLGMDLPEVQSAVARARPGRGGESSHAGGARPIERASAPRVAEGSGLGSFATASANAAAAQTEVSGQPGSAEVIILDEPPVSLRDLPSDPVTRLERDALMAVLQHPSTIPVELVARAMHTGFINPALAIVRDGIAATLDRFGQPDWFRAVADTVPVPIRTLVEQLAIAPIPQRGENDLGGYVHGITTALIDRDLLRQSHELRGRLQRTDPQDREAYRAVQTELMALEAERRALRSE